MPQPAPTVTAAYTWGAAGLVSQRRVSAGTSLWYAFGPQGETRQLTSSTGAVVDTYSYTAYGVPLGVTGSDPNPFRFGGQAGYYTDPAASGLVLCGARWYDPYTGRWLSRDPIGYEGGVNLYEYCEGNPVGALDPSGMDALVMYGCNRRGEAFFERLARGLPRYAPDARLRRVLNSRPVRYVRVRDLWDIRAALSHTDRIEALVYIGHAGGMGLYPSGSSSGTTVTIRYSDVLHLPLTHLVPGSPVALYGCHTAEPTGDGGVTLPSIARALANRTNVPVQAVLGGLSFGRQGAMKFLFPRDMRLRPEIRMISILPKVVR